MILILTPLLFGRSFLRGMPGRGVAVHRTWILVA
jgi:hypothetical protein